MPISSSRAPVNLYVDVHGLQIEDGTNTVDVGLYQISRIEAYKRDELTNDLVCFDIWLEDRAFVIHEEMRGWDAAVRRLEDLQGFDKLWFGKVSKPAFAENRTVIYERRR